MAKDYYNDVLIPEVIRFAKIRSMDPENLDEYGAAVFATWYTQNPLDLERRKSICNFEEPKEPIIYNKTSAREVFGNVRLNEDPKPKRPRRKKHGILFTAHAHPNEPLLPSPDDLLIYNRFDERRKSPGGSAAENQLIHFIIDGFICRKADKDGNITGG